MKKLITICAVICLMLSLTCVSWASIVTAPPDAPSWWNNEDGLFAYGYWQANILGGEDPVSPMPGQLFWASNYLDNTDFTASIGWTDETITLDLDNEFHSNRYKQIYIYITGTTESDDKPGATTLDTDGGIFNPMTSEGSIDGSQWSYLLFGEIHPQPSYVHLTVDVPGMINVTNIWAGEQCIPEPATICMLGFGALSLIRRKK